MCLKSFPFEVKLGAVLAFLFVFLAVSAKREFITDSLRVKRSPTKIAALFFSSDHFSPETGIDETLVLTMLGASTFKSVMLQRQNSRGSHSKNIIVAFSINTACMAGSSNCEDTDFKIVQETETNFTVVATLVSNSDLNTKCLKLSTTWHASFIEYSGHIHLPNGTEPFDNYFIVYRCGEFQTKDFLGVYENLSSALLAGVGGAMILGLILICCLAKFPNRRNDGDNEQPATRPEEFDLVEFQVTSDSTTASPGESGLPSTSTQQTLQPGDERQSHDNAGYEEHEEGTSNKDTEPLIT